jgi:IS30 family transposase
MTEIKRLHPRAYSKWEASEDETLRSLFATKTSVRDIASKLQRQPSAIRSRLLRLGALES